MVSEKSMEVASKFGLSGEGDEKAGLVDIHLHLQDSAFEPDREAVMQRAMEANVTRWVVNGSTEEDWPKVLELARSSPSVIPCFGLHPWYVSGRSKNWAELLKRHLSAVPCGLGEIGLDQWIQNRDEAAQEEVFRTQLDIARSLQKPVMIHCLHAWGWMNRVLRAEPPLPSGILFHAYGGPVELIEELVERGGFFSFAGSVLRKEHKRSQAALLKVPLDRLLLETDSPDIPPPKAFRTFGAAGPDGKFRNEPANLAAMVKGVSSLLERSPGELTAILWQNAQNFLKQLL